jgi:hypothetical protein
MDKNEVKTCEELIKKWHLLPEGKEKDNSRNTIFQIFHPFMNIWITSILCKKGKKYASQDEIMERSWDCFKYCLDTYKIEGKIPIPNHFYSYTKFYISVSKQNELKDARIKEKQDTYPTDIPDRDQLDSVYNDIEELSKFKEQLPEKYVSIFEDAIMSMATNYNQRIQRLGKTSLGYANYHEVKKVFKIVVRFLLLR